LKEIIKMCEETKCFHCGKKAQYFDGDLYLYCSKECYTLAWNVNFQKTTKKIIVGCTFCQDVVEECDYCTKPITTSEVLCDAENGMHFCSPNCLFAFYNWEEIKEEGDS